MDNTAVSVISGLETWTRFVRILCGPVHDDREGDTAIEVARGVSRGLIDAGAEGELGSNGGEMNITGW